jgi:hypothetical protein
VFELVKGNEYVIFLIGCGDNLPGDDVHRELRTLARLGGNASERGVLETVSTDITSGVIGSAAWTLLAKTFVAVASYLKHLGSAPALTDVTEVADRLKLACDQVVGYIPTSLDDAAISQLDDGRWQAQFNLGDVSISATLDPSGRIVRWIQQPAS